MTVIYVADEHHRLHWHWQQTGERDLRLCHVDFHCDLRGLRIDRSAQTASVHDVRELRHVDQGNFMTHAVMNGTVSSIRWVHDRHGGRRYDLGTVQYASDVRARWSRTRGPSVPLTFREQDLAVWTGPAEGEQLDLDWDGLACRVYSKAYSRKLAQRFLDQPFEHRPEVVYFIYSYCSSILDDDAFESFLDALRRKLDARVERLSPLPPEHSTVSATPGLARRVKSRLMEPLRPAQRWLTSTLKYPDTAADLDFPY